MHLNEYSVTKNGCKIELTTTRNSKQTTTAKKNMIVLSLIISLPQFVSDSPYRNHIQFEVITAYDGKSALDRFFSDSFSLVLLDLMIPQISGIEVMEKIRENSMLLFLPILL